MSMDINTYIHQLDLLYKQSVIADEDMITINL